MKPFTRAFATTLGTVLLPLWMLPAVAGNLSVNPVRLEVAPNRNATALTISNPGTEPELLQVRVYRWTHPASEDVLTEVQGAEAPIVTPPLFKLAPGGGSQVVRIGFQQPGTAIGKEQQWRVIVEEVPMQPAPPVTGGEAPTSPPPLGIAMRLRISVPLFRRPVVVQQDLQWSLTGTGAQPILTASNEGSVTERIDEIQLGPASRHGSRLGGPLYVFPGEHRSFPLQLEAALPPGPVTLNLNGTPRPLVRELVLRAQ